MPMKKSKRSCPRRVAATEAERAVWIERGITSSEQARSAVLRACASGGATLTLPRPAAGGPRVSWTLLFTPEEAAAIDAARGLVTSPRWLADVLGRSPNPDVLLAQELRTTLGGRRRPA